MPHLLQKQTGEANTSPDFFKHSRSTESSSQGAHTSSNQGAHTSSSQGAYTCSSQGAYSFSSHKRTYVNPQLTTQYAPSIPGGQYGNGREWSSLNETVPMHKQWTGKNHNLLLRWCALDVVVLNGDY